ncbi:serine/threonine-protein kinase HipA [Methylohalomonas lacus]|uniref:Serine/threonine-protein kinase HipA n=2 Tax=Methylohalomonas lacus TaxID=398773 RepID=A0AAE3L4H1_9GAMM|nr:serine/threonine-protein kinase HipA [Methylohalomonas lacus]
MTFKPGHTEAYIWIWLPGETDPVVCGKVAARDAGPNAIHRFVYGRSYRDLEAAIPLLPHALPIKAGEQPSRRGLHGVLRDAAPDAWGRRVLMYKLQMSVERGEAELTEIDYLLAGGQGVGALHFQGDAEAWQPKASHTAELKDMLSAAEAVEQNQPLPPELDQALLHGTSIGGARPKVLINGESGQPAIAKFSSTTDHHPMVKLEALALLLARRVGIETVTSQQLSVMNKDVLLVNRFDSEAARSGRRHFFSALTALDLDEMEARYAGYPDLADYLRHYSDDVTAQCRELFRRMLLNIMIGNSDDHARNHALFWDGRHVHLTPAYDICVMPRMSLESSQAMEVGEQGKRGTLANALSSCGRFGLTKAEALQMAEEMEVLIRQSWQEACEEAEIPEQLAANLWERTVLSPALHQD